jgi:hypothetical protein
VTQALLLGLVIQWELLAPRDQARDSGWARSAAEGARIILPPGRYVGPWRFTNRVYLTAQEGAILVPGPVDTDPGHGTLTLEKGGGAEGLVVEAPARGYAVRVERSTATFSRMHLKGRGVAGLYLAGSQVKVSASEFEGNEYGVLTAGPSSLDLAESRFHDIARAGIALVSTAAKVKDSTLVGPFSEAALTVIHSDAIDLKSLRVLAAGEIGLKFITSRGSVDGVSVEGVRPAALGSEGSGLYSYQSKLVVDGLRIDGVQGIGVHVSGGTVALARTTISHCSESAAYVGGNGSLRLVDSLVGDSPLGILVDPDGAADVKTTRFENVPRKRAEGQ